MEEKNRRTRMANNRFLFDERFVRYFAVIEILLVFLYTKHFATFSVHGNRIWVLVIVVVVFALSGLVLSWKLERNWISHERDSNACSGV